VSIENQTQNCLPWTIELALAFQVLASKSIGYLSMGKKMAKPKGLKYAADGNLEKH